MSIYELKPRFQALLRPLVGWLHRRGVTANQVTVAAMVLSIAAGAATALIEAPATWLLLPAVLLVRMALNAVDGMLAREFDQQSRLGALLNELGDVVSDAALYLPLALLPHFGWPLVAVVVVLAGLTELAGVLGQAIGAERRYDGPMGKSDRALVFGAIGLAVGLGLPAAAWQGVILPAIAGLLMLTIVRRCRAALATGTAASPAEAAS